MNKLTKLLSVFVIAGAIGTGIAGVAGCKKGNGNGDGGDKHTHHYTWVADADGNKCHEECDATGECDAKVKPSQDHVDAKNNETGATGADGKCDNCGTAITPSQHVHNYDWINNGDGTHSGTCSVDGCDLPNVTNEAHEWGENHRCIKCNVKQASYNITFNMHGEGTAPAAQEVYEGDAIVVPEKPTSDTKYFGGWYENADYTGGKFDFSKPASKSVELHARWLNKINISTAEELETFRTTATAEDGSGGLASGAYVLTADIDLEGRTLGVAASVIGDGIVFDGNGHIIKNASYNGTESKIGLLCKTVNGGEVTNVKFLNCAITSTSESIGIIAGECNSSSSISKIEFNSCSSVTTNNYAGLIFGRREGSPAIVIDISEITVKNGTSTSCAQYGG
ncbi:MAG: InlB B-repeat-containing protein, partial [Clostridia bacterium]|nr:InlB B-repeat-containing protein [Clostridia bacterium]